MEEMSQNFITVEEPVARVKYQISPIVTRKEKSYRNFGLILISNYNADADALELLALLGLLAWLTFKAILALLALLALRSLLALLVSFASFKLLASLAFNALILLLASPVSLVLLDLLKIWKSIGNFKSYLLEEVNFCHSYQIMDSRDAKIASASKKGNI